MAQAILLCGKVCSGKSTYARQLQKELPASVLLSCDALMLSLFPEGAGARHDLLSIRARQYLFDLSLEVLASGADVILDWGFWTKQWRDQARTFYQTHGISCRLHYIDLLPDIRRQYILSRNLSVEAGCTSAYFIDEGLFAKSEALFEPPGQDEIDVLYQPNER